MEEDIVKISLVDSVEQIIEDVRHDMIHVASEDCTLPDLSEEDLPISDVINILIYADHAHSMSQELDEDTGFYMTNQDQYKSMLVDEFGGRGKVFYNMVVVHSAGKVLQEKVK